MPPPSYPAMSKSGHPLGTFVFSKQYEFPVSEDRTPNQVIQYVQGGLPGNPRAIKVVDYGGRNRILTYTWRDLPLSDAEGARDWIENSSVNYALNQFTWTDALNMSFTVRFIGQSMQVVQTSYNNVDTFTLTLRVEA